MASVGGQTAAERAQVLAEADRERNRRDLRDAYERNQQMHSQQAQLQQTAEQLQAKLVEYDREMTRMRSEFSNIQGRLERESQDMQTKYHRAVDESTKRKTEVEDLRQKFQTLAKEWQGAKGETSDAKRKLTEQDKEIQNLRSKTQSVHEITAVKARADLASAEVGKLRKELEGKGIFGPGKRDDEDEAAPDVGAIDLGEDVFSARLLLRLGYVKQNLESVQAIRIEDGSDSDGAQSVSSELQPFEQVAGMFEPEIEAGAVGYTAVTSGWLFVCIMTLLVQVIILVVLFIAGLGKSCLDEEKAYPSLYWWVLHISKSVALCTAGVLLGKELMNAVNYCVVSHLVEGNQCEVLCTAFVRFAVNIFIVLLQTKMYLECAEAGEVWVNMTALGFIADLNGQVLDIAKSGALGHHIAKTMTAMNFQITFLVQYPAWFKYVRSFTIFSVTVLVGFVSVYTFVSPDQICGPGEE